jgi:uncharacterized protein YukE
MAKNDPDILHPAAMKGIGVAEDMAGTTRSMMAILQGAQWQGDGGTAFQNAALSVQSDLNAISTHLTTLSGILVNIATQTAQTDSDARTTVETVQAEATGLADALRGLNAQAASS